MKVVRLAPVLLVALVAVGLFACGGGGPSGPGSNDLSDGSGVIGPAGGTVALGEDFSVEVPAGAVAEQTEIRIREVPTPSDLEAQAAIGKAYRVEPVGLALGLPARVIVRVPSSAREGVALSAVTLLRSTAGTTGDLSPAGEELGGIQRQEERVSGATERFGIFSAALNNRPPQVSVGADRAATVGQSISVTASTSDPDGDPVSHAWSFQSRPSGSSAQLAGTSTTTVKFTPDVSGAYLLQVVVTDGNGGEATATVRVTASSAASVTADAGQDVSIFVGDTVTLDGTGSTGTNLSYSWEFVSTPGDPPAIDDAGTALPSFVAAIEGEYLVMLSVTDGSVADSDTVKVTADPGAPTVSLSGPGAVYPGTPVVIIASIRDPEGDSLGVQWSLQSPSGSGSTLEVSADSGSFTPDVIGEYRIAVQASDSLHTTRSIAVVHANPDVAGTYTAEFEVTSIEGNCGGFIQEGDSTTADMVVDQPEPGTVILRTSNFSNIDSDMTGSLAVWDFLFQGDVRVGNPQGTVTAVGEVRGPFDPDGFDLAFEFFAAGGICRAFGTMTS